MYKRTRRTVEIIVVEFLAIFAAKLERMISVDFTHDVAELERLFRKDAGSGFGLVGAEPNSIAVTQQAFESQPAVRPKFVSRDETTSL